MPENLSSTSFSLMLKFPSPVPVCLPKFSFSWILFTCVFFIGSISILRFWTVLFVSFFRLGFLYGIYLFPVIVCAFLALLEVFMYLCISPNCLCFPVFLSIIIGDLFISSLKTSIIFMWLVLMSLLCFQLYWNIQVLLWLDIWPVMETYCSGCYLLYSFVVIYTSEFYMIIDPANDFWNFFDGWVLCSLVSVSFLDF